MLLRFNVKSTRWKFRFRPGASLLLVVLHPSAACDSGGDYRLGLGAANQIPAGARAPLGLPPDLPVALKNKLLYELLLW